MAPVAVTEIVGDEEKAQELLEAAKSSMGQDISPIDLVNIQTFASRVIALAEYRCAACFGSAIVLVPFLCLGAHMHTPANTCITTCLFQAHRAAACTSTMRRRRKSFIHSGLHAPSRMMHRQEAPAADS